MQGVSGNYTFVVWEGVGAIILFPVAILTVNAVIKIIDMRHITNHNTPSLAIKLT